MHVGRGQLNVAQRGYFECAARAPMIFAKRSHTGVAKPTSASIGTAHRSCSEFRNAMAGKATGIDENVEPGDLPCIERTDVSLLKPVEGRVAINERGQVLLHRKSEK